MALLPGIPVPGMKKGPELANDPELLYSTAGFTQKGVTLAGGQGILPIGTLLARRTADKKYVAYNNAGTGGAETARGVLRTGVDTGAAGSPDVQANIVIQGILKNSLVSGADAGALTDLGAIVDAARNTFKF